MVFSLDIFKATGMINNLSIFEATAIVLNLTLFGMLYLYGYRFDHIQSNRKLYNANEMHSPVVWTPIFPVLAVRMPSTVPATLISAFFLGHSADC